MMVTSRQQIVRLVMQCINTAYRQGRIKVNDRHNITPEMLFSFRLSEIRGAFLYKRRVGAGVWFLLHDGTVWNWLGRKEPDVDKNNYR